MIKKVNNNFSGAFLTVLFKIFCRFKANKLYPRSFIPAEKSTIIGTDIYYIIPIGKIH